jgi:hypothetical protein
VPRLGDQPVAPMLWGGQHLVHNAWCSCWDQNCWFLCSWSPGLPSSRLQPIFVQQVFSLPEGHLLWMLPKFSHWEVVSYSCFHHFSPINWSLRCPLFHTAIVKLKKTPEISKQHHHGFVNKALIHKSTFGLWKLMWTHWRYFGKCNVMQRKQFHCQFWFDVSPLSLFSMHFLSF